MDKSLIKAFWNCGDNAIIEFALMRARLNRIEKEVLFMVLDDCKTQETVAEELDYSARKVQEIWRSATNKLLAIPWVKAYAKEIIKSHT